MRSSFALDSENSRPYAVLVVPVAAFGCYAAIRPRWRKHGLCLVALAAMWAVLCFAVIIPYYSEGRSYRFFAIWSHLPERLLSGSEQAGGSDLFSVDTGLYLAHLILPLGLLPLLEPGLWAVSLPSLAYHLLGDHPPSVKWDTTILPFLIPWWFLAAVHGVARLERLPAARLRARWMWLSLCLLVVGTVGIHVVLNPIRFHYRSGAFARMPHHEQVEAAMAQIPPRKGDEK